MAQLKVIFQEFVNSPGMKKDTIGLHRVEIMSTTSDHLVLPKNLIDVQMLSETKNAALPTFYQYGTSNSDRVAIDGGTVGNQYWIVSKHDLIVNQGDFTP